MSWIDPVFRYLGDYNAWFLLGLCALVVMLVLAVLRLQLAVRRVSRPRKPLPTESGITADTITDLERRIEKLEYRAGTSDDSITDLDVKLGQCARRMAVVRYDAFPDVGGEQSFALAVLDREMNGIVLSSLYGRNESRIYAKDIVRGESPHALSDEEKEALARARALDR